MVTSFSTACGHGSRRSTTGSPQYPGYIWVRERNEPLTPAQDAALTAFAVAVANTRYSVTTFAALATPFTPRGPLHARCSRAGRADRGTAVLQRSRSRKPRLRRASSTPEHAAPAATYPQDLFYDRSRNPYIDRHPPLAGGWRRRDSGRRSSGGRSAGKNVPKPPSPWPDGPAHVVYPVTASPNQPPTPVVVGHVPGELRPVALVEQHP